MDRTDFDSITTGFKTKSDKIRALAATGVARAEIAKYLQIRYQHVRNVLEGPTPSMKSETKSSSAPSQSSSSPLTIEQAKIGLAQTFGVSPDSIEIVIRG